MYIFNANRDGARADGLDLVVFDREFLIKDDTPEVGHFGLCKLALAQVGVECLFSELAKRQLQVLEVSFISLTVDEDIV